MDVIVSEVEKPVVHPGGLTEIPSLYTVTKAISILCKQTKISMKKYVYIIQLPFGLMDYKGLKELQLYHNGLKQISIKETKGVMCIVCTPDKYVNDFLTGKCKAFSNGKVILALNVGQNNKSTSVFIADGVKNKNGILW